MRALLLAAVCLAALSAAPTAAAECREGAGFVQEWCKDLHSGQWCRWYVSPEGLEVAAGGGVCVPGDETLGA